MTFVEVLRLGATGHPVGVFSGEWVATTTEPGHYVNLSASMSLVTIVQLDSNAFLANLHARLEELKLSTHAPSFPTEAAIRMGLTWNSAYWQEGALRWVQDLDWTARFRPELLVLERSGRTQHLRHWAKRLGKSDI